MIKWLVYDSNIPGIEIIPADWGSQITVYTPRAGRDDPTRHPLRLESD